jgi:hypothetical protein
MSSQREKVVVPGRSQPGRPERVNNQVEKSQMRVCVRICLVLACLFAVHSTAWAQATIAGLVQDSSGAVLPGVSVEAASPALIERSVPRSPTARDAIESKICGRAPTA